MISPIGPGSSPSTPRTVVENTDSSPSQRREGIQGHQKSNLSCPDSTVVSNRKKRYSLATGKARYSSPVLTEAEFAPSYDPQHIKPLAIPQTPRKEDSLVKRSSITTPGSKKKSAPKSKDTPSPKLLTEVAEEDFLRRSHLHNRVVQRYPSITKPIERDNISDLDRAKPLLVSTNPLPEGRKPVQEVGETLQLPVPELDASKNFRPNALYNPSLFSTQHGLAPHINPAHTKRKPVGLPTRVRFTITSSSPDDSIQKTARKSIRDHNLHKPPNKPTAANPRHSQSSAEPNPALPPISAKYIVALENTASADEATRQTKKRHRQSSLARIRELTPSSPGLYTTSSTGTPPQPLTLWIADLCQARMPVPSNPSGTTGAATATATAGSEARNSANSNSNNSNNNRILDDDADDESFATDADTESGSRKAKATPSEELTVMIDDMLNDLTGKFHAITSEIMAKMDDMGRRIDNLEASLNHGSEKGADEDDDDNHEHDGGRRKPMP